MFCVLGPEMALGDPLHAPRKRQLMDSPGGKTKKIIWRLPERPSDVKHHTLGSVFSGFGYGSGKSSVRRSASDKVTRREKKVMRAQDIFTHDANTIHNRPKPPGRESLFGLPKPGASPAAAAAAARGRSATPLSALSLDKPLPSLPDERSDFDGYIDMLACLGGHGHLPTKPGGPDHQTPAPAAAAAAPPPPQAIIRPPVREDEWISSSRSQSRQSTAYTASEDDMHRLRSRSVMGMPLHSAAASRRTVTPMSSMGSEGGLRGGCGAAATAVGVGAAGVGGPGAKAHHLLPPAPATARIEEVSEPGTSPPELTPRRRSATVPLTCYHCGRDPSGRDVGGGSPATVLETQAALGPAAHHGGAPADDAEAGREDVVDVDAEVAPEGSSPFARPCNPDPYAAENSPTGPGVRDRRRAPAGQEEVEEPADDPRRHEWPPHPDHRHHHHHDPRPPAGDAPREEAGPSFWKNPEGVILVYQGVEVNGDELYYGSEINYLGSFYDEDEGSSGLGSTKDSTADLVGAAGSGLAMIPEGRSSDDLWDDEAFGAVREGPTRPGTATTPS